MWLLVYANRYGLLLLLLLFPLPPPILLFLTSSVLLLLSLVLTGFGVSPYWLPLLSGLGVASTLELALLLLSPATSADGVPEVMVTVTVPDGVMVTVTDGISVFTTNSEFDEAESVDGEAIS